MGIINVLDFQVANLIAAGEVVERPASAVKELMENAVDAGATDIAVEIKRGGIAFMRVTDNGCGMSKEDLPVCIKRHATSKIHDGRDLDGIATLGFRGEALAAICSVSDMRIMTRRAEDPLGMMMTCKGGQIVDLSEVGGAVGTTVILENLFANVPARRKFLKKDSSEAMAVTAVAERMALSRPDISMRLIIDGVPKFSTPGNGQVLDVIHAVIGREFSSRLTLIHGMNDGIEVQGYIGRPDNVRSNRNYQIFFINGRYVRSKTATAALEQAFSSYLETEKFPACVLYITIHPSFVDVNVHPTKLEVKFSNEQAVFDAVYCAVRNALVDSSERAQIQLEPEQMKPEDRSLYNAFVPVYDRVDGADPGKVSQSKLFDLPVAGDEVTDQPGEKMQPSAELTKANPVSEPVETPKNEPLQSAPFTVDGGSRGEFRFTSEFEQMNEEVPHFIKAQEKVDPPKEDKNPYLFSLASLASEVNPDQNLSYSLLGIAFNAYIIVELENKIWLIDKHAAHERILFEDMKKIMKAQKADAQTLLIPLSVELTPEEESAARDFENEITSLGFSYGIDDGRLNVTTVPARLSSDSAYDMLVSMLGALASGTGSVTSAKNVFFEKALYQASCKAAMKAGRDDSDVHQKWLVERLLSIPDVKYCPHGRPVLFELTKAEIEKYFKRT